MIGHSERHHERNTNSAELRLRYALQYEKLFRCCLFGDCYDIGTCIKDDHVAKHGAALSDGIIKIPRR